MQEVCLSANGYYNISSFYFEIMHNKACVDA